MLTALIAETHALAEPRASMAPASVQMAAALARMLTVPPARTYAQAEKPAAVVLALTQAEMPTALLAERHPPAGCC